MRRATTARLAACATVGALVVGCQSSGSVHSGGAAGPGTVPVAAAAGPATDFRDPAQLASALEQEIDGRLADPTNPHYSPGVTALRVQCVPIAGSRTDFQCVVLYSNQESDGAEAIVAPDGQSWVTK